MRIIEDNAYYYYNYKRKIRVSFTIRSISLDCHLIIKQGKSVKAVLSLVSLLVAQLDVILARSNRTGKNRATRGFDRFDRFNSGFLFSRFLQCFRPVLCPFPGWTDRTDRSSFQNIGCPIKATKSEWGLYLEWNRACSGSLPDKEWEWEECTTEIVSSFFVWKFKINIVC